MDRNVSFAELQVIWTTNPKADISVVIFWLPFTLASGTYPYVSCLEGENMASDHININITLHNFTYPKNRDRKYEKWKHNSHDMYNDE
jgi:hypothetical protein